MKKKLPSNESSSLIDYVNVIKNHIYCMITKEIIFSC